MEKPARSVLGRAVHRPRRSTAPPRREGCGQKLPARPQEDLQTHVHGLWLQKCCEDVTTLCSQGHQSPFPPESQTQPRRTGSTSGPTMPSPPVTPSLPGSWAQSTVLLTGQTADAQRCPKATTVSMRAHWNQKQKSFIICLMDFGFKVQK